MFTANLKDFIDDANREADHPSLFSRSGRKLLKHLLNTLVQFLDVFAGFPGKHFAGGAAPDQVLR